LCKRNAQLLRLHPFSCTRSWSGVTGNARRSGFGAAGSVMILQFVISRWSRMPKDRRTRTTRVQMRAVLHSCRRHKGGVARDVERSFLTAWSSMTLKTGSRGQVRNTSFSQSLVRLRWCCAGLLLAKTLAGTLGGTGTSWGEQPARAVLG
jgi:hypothetical protein